MDRTNQRSCRLQARRPQAGSSHLTYFLLPILAIILVSTIQMSPILAAEEAGSSAKPAGTQASVERQLDSRATSGGSASPAKAETQTASQLSAAAKAAQRARQQVAAAISKKASVIESQQNYDKYQLKATNSNSHSHESDKSSTAKASSSESGEKAKVGEEKPQEKQQSTSSPAVSSSQKKLAERPKSSSFSLFKKLWPSFMSSAGPGMAAVAGAAASAFADKHQMSHSRSSQSGSGEVAIPILAKASGKIINLLSSATASKKSSMDQASPSFLSNLVSASKSGLVKPAIDRQAGGLTASSLLSNPLSLGLLFSAPLIPSLLLTPLAIAGLSPAMSALNNLFGDDDDTTPASAASSSLLGNQQSPLSVLTGPSSPLSSILQGNPQQAAANIQSALSSAAGSSSNAGTGGFALQAMQTFLGPPATTEKPLFNPGLFASQGIQNAVGSLDSSSSSSSSSSSGSSSGSPIRNFFGGGGGGSGNSLIQTAASMISPTFAAPPNSASADSDDGPGFMQAASEVFDKVANYMSPLQGEKNANGAVVAATSAGSQAPWADLFGLSGLSGLLSGSAHQASSPAGHQHQKVGFFTTLKNVYELFTSSFLRRQEIGDNSNECQQRLICELHQRAMNSKLFRRSVQTNLLELANLDRNLQEQIKTNPMQARVDADTKAMLNDFLKATNNFKNGRELVNCSKMFPKCSRLALLSTANAHLTDAGGNKAIGKFSSLMKKMKFKAAQQHQSQWKLRKANKSNGLPQHPGQQQQQQQAFQPADYFQVAPLSAVPQMGAKPQAGQLTPADSLKFVQQMMMMSQQQLLPQQVAYNQNQQVLAQSNIPQQQQQQVPMAAFNNYPQAQQFASQPAVYSDAAASIYPATETPFFAQSQMQQQQQVLAAPSANLADGQLQQQMAQMQQGPTSTSVMPEAQQLATLSNMNKSKPQAA